MKSEFTVSVYIRTYGPDVRVLLVRHHRFPGMWIPVGGHIEEGENPLQAARRKALQEAGLTPVFAPSPMDSLGLDVPHGYLGYEEHHGGAYTWHCNLAFMAYVEREAADRILKRHVQKGDQQWKHYQWFDDPPVEECPPNVYELAWKALGHRHPADSGWSRSRS